MSELHRERRPERCTERHRALCHERRLEHCPELCHERRPEKLRARRYRSLVVALACVAIAAPVAAQLSSAERARFDDCLVCHGTDARGNPAIGAPALAALEPGYLQRQLEAYRAGRRGSDERDDYGAEMRPVAAQLDAGDIERVSRAFLEMPMTPGEATVIGDVERGAALYVGCAACHGDDGRGRLETGAPRLSGQRDWYLERQMIAFRDGVRGAGPDDTLAAQMSAAARIYDDADVRDVVAYINSLSERDHETANEL